MGLKERAIGQVFYKENHLLKEDGTAYTGQMLLLKDSPNKFTSGKQDKKVLKDKGLKLLPHGQGTETWPDGTYYSGEYVNGVAHGLGTIFFSNGDMYQGDFKHKKYDGFGQLYDLKEKVKYIGYW